MTLHQTCAFQVIKLPNERVIALFHHFFLQFLHIAEIGQKGHNTTTSSPLSHERSNKQWLRFIEGVAPPPNRSDILVEMA